MSIAFYCPNCSKKLKAGEEFAGKRVRCSGCKNVVAVPRSGPVMPSTRPSAVAPKMPGPRRSVPTGQPVPRGLSKDWWYLGGGVAAGLVVLCVVLFAVAGKRAETEVAQVGSATSREVKLEPDRTKIEELTASTPSLPSTPGVKPRESSANSAIAPLKESAPKENDRAQPAPIEEPPAKRPLVKPLPPAKLVPQFDFGDLEKSDRIVVPLNVGEPLGLVPAVWEGHTNLIGNLAWTDDAKFVVSASGDFGSPSGDQKARPPDYSIRIWDASRGTQIHKLEVKEPLFGLASSPGGRLAVFGYSGVYRNGRWVDAKDRNLHMLDVLEKNEIYFPGTGDPAAPGGERPALPRFRGSTGTVFDTAFSPDRRLVASVANGFDNLFVWETTTGKLLMRRGEVSPPGFPLGSTAVRFTPDGRKIVCAGNNRVWIYDLATGRKTATLLGHRDRVLSLAVTQTPEGRMLAISGGGSRVDLNGNGFVLGAKDYAIRMWDLDARREIRQFAGHRKDVTSLVFRPKSQQFLSASHDGTVRLWDGETGELLRTFEGHVGGIHALAVSPNGDFAVSGGNDCLIHRWELPPLPN
jgi:WD40 repeat protein